MRLSEIAHGYEQQIKDLITDFNVGPENRGRIDNLKDYELLGMIKDGELQGLSNDVIANKFKDKEVKFPIKIREVRFMELTDCTVKTYSNWPSAGMLQFNRCYVGKGLGNYIKETRSTLQVRDSFINLEDFELILDANVMFDIATGGLERLAYDGHEYSYIEPGTSQSFKSIAFKDVFELQDYLMSTDKWKKFFTQL